MNFGFIVGNGFQILIGSMLNVADSTRVQLQKFPRKIQK